MIRDGTAMALLWFGALFWWCYSHIPWMFDPGNEWMAIIGGIVTGNICLFVRMLYDAEPNYDDDDE